MLWHQAAFLAKTNGNEPKILGKNAANAKNNFHLRAGS
jgi:hypothetical protein